MSSATTSDIRTFHSFSFALADAQSDLPVNEADYAVVFRLTCAESDEPWFCTTLSDAIRAAAEFSIDMDAPVYIDRTMGESHDWTRIRVVSVNVENTEVR